jgi:hypothetical protein
MRRIRWTQIRSRTDHTDATSDLTLGQIADRLADAVAKQWQDEAQLRRLYDPHPLPVAWQPASPDLVEDWDGLRVTANGWPGGSPPTRLVGRPARLSWPGPTTSWPTG